MKTVYFIIVVLTMSSSLALTFHQTFAVDLSGPISSEEVLEKYDLIVLGTITHIEKQVKEDDDEPAVFHMGIEEIIKDDGSFENNDNNSQIFKTIGCTPKEENLRGHWCPRYDIGDRGLFLLSNTEQGYDIAFHSQTSKVNCTAEQFLDNYQGWKTGLFWNQTSNDYGYSIPKHLFTNEAIELYHTVRNQDMKEKDYSVKFNARTGQSAFSDVVNGTIPECKRELTVSSIFVPTVMGTYGFFIGPNDDTGAGSGFFGTPIIDFGATPKEQLNAGIKGQDIWCKDNLVLIFKNDDTPDRRYDNHTACVTVDTAEKLIQRNWGFVLG